MQHPAAAGRQIQPHADSDLAIRRIERQRGFQRRKEAPRCRLGAVERRGVSAQSSCHEGSGQNTDVVKRFGVIPQHDDAGRRQFRFRRLEDGGLAKPSGADEEEGPAALADAHDARHLIGAIHQKSTSRP